MSNTTFRSEEANATISHGIDAYFLLDTNEARPHINFIANSYESNSLNHFTVSVYRNPQKIQTMGTAVKSFITNDTDSNKAALEFYTKSAFTPMDKDFWCSFTISPRSDFKALFSLILKDKLKYGINVKVIHGAPLSTPIGLSLQWTEAQ